MYSGKTQTKAAALAQKVVEDLRNFDTRTKRYAIFGYVATDSSSTNKTYDSQTATALSDTLLQAIRTNWETQVEELPKGYIECKLYNVGGTNLSNCTFIRYDLKVHWTEGERARELTFNFAF